jgi:L-alanine-DL-glutamate epimerase-like enolase superfamily enzyme
MASIEAVEAHVFEVPTATDQEQDGTLTWSSTQVVVVEIHSGGHTGLGYTYAHPATADIIEQTLAPIVTQGDSLEPQASWARMQVQIRQSGHAGLAAMAVSAVDIALWDLKARQLDIALADLLGRFQSSVEIYGSGGFCNLDETELRAQVEGWHKAGVSRMKIKVGARPQEDLGRVALVQALAGPDVEVMVDANGAYSVPEALAYAAQFATLGVAYLEEPVSSLNVGGLAAVRARAPAGMAIAAGEYAWNLATLHGLLHSGAVDILQADVTRCGGITNLLRVDGLCRACEVPFSAHCAPGVSAHVCAAMESARHIEYFFDHVRVEAALFDGNLVPRDGRLEPDRSRSGHGLSLNSERASAFAISS